MIYDRKYDDDTIQTILEEWDAETLIPCHGDIIRGREKIKQVLYSNF